MYRFDLECVKKALQAASFEDPVVKERVFEQDYLASYRRFFKSARIARSFVSFGYFAANTGGGYHPINTDHGIFLVTSNPQPWFSSNLTTIPLLFDFDDFQTGFDCFADYFNENLCEDKSDTIASSISARNIGLLDKSYLANPARSLVRTVAPKAWNAGPIFYKLRIDSHLRVNGFAWSYLLILKLLLIEIHRTTRHNAEKVLKEMFPRSELLAVRAPFPLTFYSSYNIDVGDITDNRATATMCELNAGYYLAPSIPVLAPLLSICIGASSKCVHAKGQTVRVFLSKILKAPINDICRFNPITISVPNTFGMPPHSAKKLNLFLQEVVWALPIPDFIDNIDCSIIPALCA